MKREDIVKTANSLKGEEGHIKILDVYNSQKPLPQGYKVKKTDAWCATFVSAVFLMNNYPDISECSCPRMIEKAKKKDIWVEDDAYTPQIGDIIMYDWQDSGKGDNVGVADHVGIVISVTKNKVVIREGNKNRSIGNRDVTINGLYIRGYITPHYDETSQKATESKKETKTSKSSSKKEKTVNEPAKVVKMPYEVGKIYTINVSTALNVRRGPGKQYALVGYNNLTPDGKKHAYSSSGALKNGTRVSCLEVKVITETNVWMKIPSGWICCIDGTKKHVI